MAITVAMIKQVKFDMLWWRGIGGDRLQLFR